MPRGSRWQLANNSSRPTSSSTAVHEDVETGKRMPKGRFHDAVSKVVRDGRRVKIKQQLLEGMERLQFEDYRKGQDELKNIKEKKVRQFYERQNGNLDEWLEVDMIVRSLADDILDSFDPQDSDGDGVPEPGPLQQLGDDVLPFLPYEERQRRLKEKKYAKIAINVNVIANIFLLAAKIFAIFYSSSLSLIASAVDSALDLLCTLIIFSTNKLVQYKIKALNKRFPIGRRRLEPIGILVFCEFGMRGWMKSV